MLRTYEVINRPLRRDGRSYKVSASIRLEDDNAAVLLAVGRVQLSTNATKAPPASKKTARAAPRKSAKKK